MDLYTCVYIYELFMMSVSALCSMAVIMTWFVLPKWRNLHNFVSLQHIVTGTLHVCIQYIIQVAFDDQSLLRTVMVKTMISLNFLTMSWSLCGQLHAYSRIVLMLTSGKTAEDWKGALDFSYSAAAVLMVITDGVMPLYAPTFILLDSRFLWQDPYSYTFRSLGVTILTTVNVLLYANIARAVLAYGVRGALAKRWRRLAGLVGIAVLSDLITGILQITKHVWLLYIDGYDIYTAGFNMIFVSRFVIQTVVVLLNVRSRQQFARYFQMRRNRQLNRV